MKGKDKERHTFRNPFPLAQSKCLQWPDMSWSKTRRQELLPGLPQGFSGLRIWAILCCLLRAQTGSWITGEGARTGTGTHMGSRCGQGKHFSHCAIAPGLRSILDGFYLQASILSWVLVELQGSYFLFHLLISLTLIIFFFTHTFKQNSCCRV